MSKKPRRIDDSRLLAFEVLVQVELEGAYSNLILPKALTDSALEVKDRTFATELVYGSLRMQGSAHRAPLGKEPPSPPH